MTPRGPAAHGERLVSKVLLVRLAAVDQSLGRLLALLSRKQARVRVLQFDAGPDEQYARVEIAVRGSQLTHLIAAVRREVLVIGVDEE
jgi:hypothetical protein